MNIDHIELPKMLNLPISWEFRDDKPIGSLTIYDEDVIKQIHQQVLKDGGYDGTSSIESLKEFRIYSASMDRNGELSYTFMLKW